MFEVIVPEDDVENLCNLMIQRFRNADVYKGSLYTRSEWKRTDVCVAMKVATHYLCDDRQMDHNGSRCGSNVKCMDATRHTAKSTQPKMSTAISCHNR